MSRSERGVIFAIDETAMHDGPGIRMAVYLKGCPLRCVWCHSPESILPRPEVVWYQTRCKRCGACLEVCPRGLRSNQPVDDRDRSACGLCGKCVEACGNAALGIKGEEVTAGEIAEHAVELKPFLQRSGGGITLTGGEPSMQAGFSMAVLELCKSQGISTAVETCGYADWEVLKGFLPVTDLFLFDLKHPSPDLHRKYTGASNELILENLRRLVASGAVVTVRMPLIPGLNDDRETVREAGRRARSVGVERVTLLPYNPASPGKYGWFHREYPIAGAERQSDAYLTDLEDLLTGEGLKVAPA